VVTSDIGSEDIELQEIPGLEGVNILDMVEDWRKKGVENILEEEIWKINTVIIAKQKAEMEMHHRKLGVVKGKGARMKSVLQTTSGSTQKKKRGHRTNSEVLQEMGYMLINSGKMKALDSFSFGP